MAKKKNTKKRNNIQFISIIAICIVVIVGLIVGAKVKIEHEQNKTTITIAEEQIEPVMDGDLGEFDEDILTVEEIDGGGLFKDELNIENGEQDLYYELGSIEEVDTSSPEAFKKSTLGRCIVANNVFGAQCVSLSRAFWWSYAGYDVSTCGTGLAKGMMNCADENARDKFEIIWETSKIQNGTWIVLDGSRTGHICMALGKPNHGYVACLGENQGGSSCDKGGASTNIVNISLKNFIGGYTPKDYIEPEPTPVPTPIVPDTGRL